LTCDPQNLQTDAEEDPLAKLKGHKIVSCRICKGDHWTTKCPYKDTLAPPQENADSDKAKEGEGGASAGSPAAQRLGKYVPPNMRDGGNRRGETMMGNRRGIVYTCQSTAVGFLVVLACCCDWLSSVLFVNGSLN